MSTTQTIVNFFSETRAYSEQICKPLEVEDYVVQPVVDVSPPKWHLGHTTWFFEEFILKPHKQGYKLFSDDFAFVFNSYYESVGKRVVRTDRGNLSRPTVAQVYSYRDYVTQSIEELLEEPITEQVKKLLTIGIHHEKQHQELLITDIKYILGNNPLMPKYEGDILFRESEKTSTPAFINIKEGVYDIGHATAGFCYDNELSRHKVYIQNFEISTRLVTNGEWIDFIDAGGYTSTLLWHAEGWDWVQNNAITAPMYWHKVNGEWYQYTLDNALERIDLKASVSHISYFEAFAYAEWKEMRLPTEFEWEIANKHFNWGDRWEWTESAYLPYPNYTKAPGALGEYNGKFMVNQKVLRGGSVATPNKHTRHTYRNFFQTSLRWQFTGLRLVKK
ncbi:ergothioneine biosynthesis protein EgtB [Dokdonia sp. Hel_I_53]|uniref:ergothioneine biosynthesis protein EgtB n=1 Tax=Dokdonia sp. Hel_I_53 TaxID=1566287 RepID=UPI00119959BB|nr:ergothioneine biosynthesis protein EgtB [Dokdonia sp. Hel_I_53]TVZ52975.1 ergothioneine biosynthesis protein EgtB [Dokdonia sp. Hel_I_53]